MSNLLASLSTAANSMKAYEQALAVVQNNVSNANTPGYVKQQADFISLAFQPELNLPGGVRTGTLISSRDLFSERAVWQQSERNGRLSQLSAGLSQIEPVLDITSQSGIAGAIDRLYSSFSRLSVTPNDIPARQNVISQAGDVARVVNFAATSLARSADQSRREVRSITGEINQVAADIRDLNTEFRQDYRKRNDAGLNARLYSKIEQLSKLADFNALVEQDGTVTVLLGGQSPLVIGDKSFAISADLSGSTAKIVDYNGKDITGQINQGKLMGALDLYNQRLPEYQGKLDRLAQALADAVNNQLAAGVDTSGLPPAVDLFTYDATNGAAGTLAVTNITPDQIAAANLAAPGGNGNALNLAALASSKQVDGFTLTEFYGQLGATLGQDISTARDDERSSSLLLSQARYLRDQKSAVDLNEEAAALIQYQRSYQAAAQLVKVINDLTEVMMSILR